MDDLIRSRDFGQYADESGELVVCFIHGTDITGGNSGSPVLDANGDLIGCAFDGNWEAMSGDIAFETELQRTISVDIRYVTWILDKFAGAQNLIDEMDLFPACVKRFDAVEMKAAPPWGAAFLCPSTGDQTAFRLALMMPNMERTTRRFNTSASHFDDSSPLAN